MVSAHFLISSSESMPPSRSFGPRPRPIHWPRAEDRRSAVVSLRNSTTPHRAAFRKDLEIVEAGISLQRLRSKPVQQCFVDLGFQCYASDPFFHKELLKLICNDLKPTDEQIVLYVFFACTTISWPTQRSFRPLKPELKVAGDLTRAKKELPGMDWSRS